MEKNDPKLSLCTRVAFLHPITIVKFYKTKHCAVESCLLYTRLSNIVLTLTEYIYIDELLHNKRCS